ncbi:MAG: chain-length determining protein [Bacteroidaceae bacterium]|nr:chain-length determining protein [Bacteroidaceae bacterium]MBQ5573742.1 chain-length determining protein [Bacteroidaceae bacterium]MBR4303671.1 chain-length determining protein [Bacteroidaceae bacterium]
MENNGLRDIISIVMLLWSKRKRLIINVFIGGLLSIIVAYSIPKEYTSTVVLAPEFSSGMSMSGSISSLASMAGIDLGSGSEDALYPELYPQIVSSVPFLCELLETEVAAKYKRDTINVTLYEYIKEYQRDPWWISIIGAPGKMIQKMKNNLSVDSVLPSVKNNNYILSRRQQLVMRSLNEKIGVNVDKGTSVITLSVTMQDPHVAAKMTQVVSDKLQEYIKDYRTAKAKSDYEQTERIFSESQSKYLKAKQAYAEYYDKHQNITKMQYQIEMDRLQNEQEVAFNVYNQLAQQLEITRSKLLESTPVVVVVEPPILPYKASSPKKMMMGLLYVFLAFFGTAFWIILKDRIIDK